MLPRFFRTTWIWQEFPASEQGPPPADQLLTTDGGPCPEGVEQPSPAVEQPPALPGPIVTDSSAADQASIPSPSAPQEVGYEVASQQPSSSLAEQRASLEEFHESDWDLDTETDPEAADLAAAPALDWPVRRAAGRKKGSRGTRSQQPAGGGAAHKPAPAPSRVNGISPQQRLLLLDTWRRSGLPAGDFADLVGISKHTLYAWKQRFEKHGPLGLMDRSRAAQQKCRLPEATKRAILMLKEAHPDWGCQRITDMLARGPALAASVSAVARVLHEAGYVSTAAPTRPHPDHPRRFERARPNQLWQTDLFTFMLKRQNRRVYLVAFMDDHSRFMVSYGLHASQSTALVLEVLEAALANYGAPEEILTDNGAQYVTWRGKSQFTRQLEKRGIRQIVAHPRRPQTLGKIERFWGSLWRECLEAAVFMDLDDARRRIGLYLDYYNFFRPHQGLDGTGQVPADRYFHAAPEVLETLKARVSANALELARHGVPQEPFYLTGQLAGEPFSVHRAGERLILTRSGQQRQEIELAGNSSASPKTQDQASVLPEPVCPDGSPAPAPGEPATRPPAEPGESALDEFLKTQQQDAAQGGAGGES